MPSSTFVLNEKPAREFLKRIKNWVESNPRGTKIDLKAASGSVYPQKVTFSSCSTTRTRRPTHDDQRCEIELMDENTGGLANFIMEFRDDGLSEFQVIDADYPYPLEFDFLEQQIGKKFFKRDAYCFEEDGMMFCPAFQVIGGGIAAQKGGFSDPDLWEKAKQKHPNDTYMAWRWYWDELKKKQK